MQHINLVAATMMALSTMLFGTSLCQAQVTATAGNSDRIAVAEVVRMLQAGVTPTRVMAILNERTCLTAQPTNAEGGQLREANAPPALLTGLARMPQCPQTQNPGSAPTASRPSTPDTASTRKILNKGFVWTQGGAPLRGAKVSAKAPNGEAASVTTIGTGYFEFSTTSQLLELSVEHPEYQSRRITLGTAKYAFERSLPDILLTPIQLGSGWSERKAGTQATLDDLPFLAALVNAKLYPEDFVWIPAGSHIVGDPTSFRNPATKDSFPKGFWIQRHETTNEQWYAVMGIVGSGDNARECARCPVEHTWPQILTFLSALNDRTGSPVFRLPTEREWRYALRAGSASPIGWTDDIGEYAHLQTAAVKYAVDSGPSCRAFAQQERQNNARNGRYVSTATIARACEAEWRQAFERIQPWAPRPVMQLRSNTFGLFDMIGNACETVLDRKDGMSWGADTASFFRPSRKAMGLPRNSEPKEILERDLQCSNSPIEREDRASTVGFRLVISTRPPSSADSPK